MQWQLSPGISHSFGLWSENEKTRPLSIFTGTPTAKQSACIERSRRGRRCIGRRSHDIPGDLEKCKPSVSVRKCYSRNTFRNYLCEFTAIQFLYRHADGVPTGTAGVGCVRFLKDSITVSTQRGPLKDRITSLLQCCLKHTAAVLDMEAWMALSGLSKHTHEHDVLRQ